jgi:phosphoglycolate phosphatase
MLVVIDLDGTLTDPFEGIRRSLGHALTEMSLPPLSPMQQRAFIGPPLHDSLAALGLDTAGVEAAVRHYREYFSDVDLDENRMFDGVPEALEEFLNRGVTLAVATSKPTSFAERILVHFELASIFSFVSGSTLSGTRRHKTDVIDFALAVEPAQAVMVGDRAQDMAGAAASGVRGVGVRWGYAERGELEAAGADRIVESPAELAQGVLG